MPILVFKLPSNINTEIGRVVYSQSTSKIKSYLGMFRNDLNDTDRKMQIHTFWSKRSGSSPGVETKLLTPLINSNNNIQDDNNNPEHLDQQHNTRRFQAGEDNIKYALRRPN